MVLLQWHMTDGRMQIMDDGGEVWLRKHSDTNNDVLHLTTQRNNDLIAMNIKTQFSLIGPVCNLRLKKNNQTWTKTKQKS